MDKLFTFAPIPSISKPPALNPRPHIFPPFVSEPSEPQQSILNDILKYIVSVELPELAHTMRFLLTSKQLYSVETLSMKTVVHVNECVHLMKPESLKSIIALLKKFNNIQVFQQNTPWNVSRDPLIRHLATNAASLRDLSLHFQDDAVTWDAIKFNLPKLRHLHLNSPPAAIDAFLTSISDQLEVLALPWVFLSYHLRKGYENITLKNLNVLEVMHPPHPIHEVRMRGLHAILPLLNVDCKIHFTDYADVLDPNFAIKGAVVDSRFQTIIAVVPAPHELDQHFHSYFGGFIRLDRIWINHMPFYEYLLNVLLRIAEVNRLYKPTRTHAGTIMVDLYKKAKNFDHKTVLRNYTRLILGVDGNNNGEPILDPATWSWLIGDELQHIEQSYDVYDPDGEYLVNFCSCIVIRAKSDGSPGVMNAAIDRIIAFSEKRNRRIRSVIQELADKITRCFVYMLPVAFHHGEIGSMTVDVVNSWTSERLVALDDNALIQYFHQPLCASIVDPTNLLTVLDYRCAGNWALLRCLLRMRHRERKSAANTVIFAPLKFSAQFLTSESRSEASVREALNDILQDRDILSEFALSFDDSPMLFKREFVDFHYKSCLDKFDTGAISIVDLMEKIFRPWISLQEIINGKPGESSSFSHLCSDRRVASLFCRTMLSHAEVNFGQFVSAAIDIFPPLASELRDFCTGKSALYSEQIRSSKISLEQAIKIVDNALTAAGCMDFDDRMEDFGDSDLEQAEDEEENIHDDVYDSTGVENDEDL